MNIPDTIARIVEQERSLIFPAFDEEVAFRIGSSIRSRAVADGAALTITALTWDRTLFFAATAGTTADNADWMRRKANVVRRFQKSTYRMVLERGSNGDRLLPANLALSPEDYVLAGGGFPVRMAGIGIVGAVVVSGLPERDDHNFAVWGICDVLGVDPAVISLPIE